MILIGPPLRCQDLHAIAHGAPVALAPEAARRMARNEAATPPGPSALERKARWLIGEHARQLSPEDLPRAFLIGHCAGVGEPLPVPAVRAAMAARAQVLAQGLSGCRPRAAEVLIELLNAGLHPVVPSQGSVGAAGDLAPMAHIAAFAAGWLERPAGLPDYQPTPKEALALINGVSLTAALSALAVVRAGRVFDAALGAAAMSLEALEAQAGCLDEAALQARGQRGGVEVAARLRELLRGSSLLHADGEPDAFSLRASPAVLGAARDLIVRVEGEVEAELNGASDNPLLLPDEEGGAARWVETGNFHGAPLSVAMDQLRLALAQLAGISERRTFRLSHGQLGTGLPSFLVPGTGLNSGFMLAQYTAASLCSELKGLCHPASVDSIPTVQHHEDHNSMGPIAARLSLEAVECAADVVAIEALLAAQALDLRRRGWRREAVGGDGRPGSRSGGPLTFAPAVEAMLGRVRARVPYWEDDGLMHPALVAVGRLVRGGGLVQDSSVPW